MNFSTVKVLPDDVMKALCNTLLHSLWQGLLLAAIAALIIVCTRKQTAAKRYNLLLVTLGLFALGIGLTFAIELKGASAGLNTPGIDQTAIAANNHPAQPITNPVLAPLTFTDYLTAYFNRNTQAVVLIWLIIVCVRSLQLVTGLHSLYYLRRKAIAPVDGVWQSRVQQLALQLGIRQVVGIAQSGLARVPMVIGHLKPLILIPAGMITALPPAEVEAILIHELAHILRKDYLANLLISLMEILFFFNPAVWWITSLIRAERENCCDDIAIAQTSSKVNYIRALVSCQEYQLSAPAYAMAFARKPNHLLNRATRLLSNSNQSLNLAEKSLLAFGLVAAGLLMAAFSNAGQISKLVTATTSAVVGSGGKQSKKVRSTAVTTITTTTTTDTMKTDAKQGSINAGNLRIYQPNEFGDHTSLQLPNHQYTTYLLKERGILYQLNLKGKTLISMQVNGKAVPAESLVVYQPVINQMLNKQAEEPAELKFPLHLLTTSVGKTRNLRLLSVKRS
ncbi:M56 family metallopeptidase [Mucilaginibacter paludis]|uniref:Peptidase M56 BlaR1 n=1 Tax=Mucilaginibacter paludis DSM 18603 TaxID=714943 RepID=H1Y7N3_9SPHI|nr:M56 family metallopeptidase [Mucilaginibacter paludis]EHQ29878.1 peptidase M56 BlaR1 [Mucilaginibacter paludis DSM 18603]